MTNDELDSVIQFDDASTIAIRRVCEYNERQSVSQQSMIVLLLIVMMNSIENVHRYCCRLKMSSKNQHENDDDEKRKIRA
jgi:hypothetical protein